MFRSFSRSWALVKASYSVLKSDKELVVFPIISFFGVLLVTIAFAIPLFASGFLSSSAREGSTAATGFGIVQILILFLFYVVMYTVIIFSQSALIGAASIRLNGGDPTLSDGFRIAQEHLSTILGYAIICATVGVILNMLSNAARSNRSIAGRIIAELVISAIGFAWNVATFLAVPVLVLENVGPIDAVKRSTALLKKTWGEQLAANFSMGAIFGLAILAVILVGVLLIAVFGSMNAGALVVLTVIVMVVAVLTLMLFSSALGGIYQAALYRYAMTGGTDDNFTPDMVQGAFKSKSKVGGF